MFTTAKRVYSGLSSVCRPLPSFVAEQFKDLEKEGLGSGCHKSLHCLFQEGSRILYK